MPQNTRKSTQKSAQKSGKRSVSQAQLLLHKIEMGFEKNQKAIISVVVVIAIAVGGFFGYKYFILYPKEQKAATALSYAQQWFAIDSFNLVLNGDGLNGGALDVIRKYGGTKSANLAHYYAGISYLNAHDPQNAIKQLSEFNGKNTAVEYMAYGALGDAYMDAKNLDKGIEYYKKAASIKDDFITPLYLFRAGLACELKGEQEEAKKLYQQIKKDYPYSQQGQDIDKYLARLGDIAID